MFKVSDVMTKRVESVSPDSDLHSAIATMLTHHVSGIPVINAKHQLVGIITDGDLLRRVETETERSHGEKPLNFLQYLVRGGREMEDYIRSHSYKVSDLMTKIVISINKDAPLAEAVRLMEKHRVRRLPVLEENRVVGMISRADLIATLAQKLHTGNFAEALSDNDLRKDILMELHKTTWFGRDTSLDVNVVNGCATLQGIIHDDRLRDAIRVAVERVPGIKRLNDKLVYVDPATGAFFPS